MHWCKWCQARRSGSHRKHRDNPAYRSKMQIKQDGNVMNEQDWQELWNMVYEYAAKLRVRPEQLFGYTILKAVEAKLKKK